MRDRIELDHWSRSASRAGISRIRLEAPEPSDAPGTGHFLLLYVDGDEWARWGVAPREDGLVEVWLMTDGSALGCFASLAEALERVVPG